MESENHLNIEDLQQQINELTMHIKSLYEKQASNASAPPPTKVKIYPPSTFTGVRAHSKSFLGQCELVFNTQPTIYNDDTKKINFACSYLRDNAFTWYLTSDLAKPDNKNTYAKFCELFLTAFGDTDLESKAKMELRALKQRGSCANYTTEFNRIASNTLYNDAAKLDLYHLGLKDEVKDLLLTMEPSDDLKTYQKNAIRCDDRLYQRRIEKKSHPFTKSDRYYNPSEHSRHRQPERPSRSTPDHDSGPTPMDIDNMKLVNGHLSVEERRRRFENQLCMYCGKPGHLTRSCPQKLSGKSRFQSGNGPSRIA